MDYPLRVAVIWHMHQPYYKDLATGEYLLPWVRLHATKDYLDMAAILDGYPGIRQTFNLVPSLLYQIEDYARGDVKDTFLDLSIKKAEELTDNDKEFILGNFFLANWDTMIKPFPRYWEILHKRGLHCSKGQIKEVVRYFSDDEMRDIQVLFNLCWFDPSFLKGDKFLGLLVKKERGYTEDEKLKLLEKQREITGKVIPNYKRLAEEGRIELSTTPFYHPILPLLCDTDVGRVAVHDMNLPSAPFRHPEDAERQLQMAVDYHRKTFGEMPKGMWPSEGSVSEDAVRLIAKQGLKWIATDEEILEASSHKRVRRGGYGIPENPEFLYKPYSYSTPDGDVAMLFRDHQLSDLIGFVYSSWDADAAAGDFMEKLHGIRRKLGDTNKNGDHIVTVILDGENCWEHYKNDGWDFLDNLYGRVESDDLIEMVTVSEHLEEYPPASRLKRVFPGSWINHNFRIWIGHAEDNLAWDYLKMTRDALREAEKEGTIDEKNIKTAWEHIYIAEGSDWCWWYGDEHSTDNDADFDALFRKNLINVYSLIGKETPEAILRPIIRTERHIAPLVKASSLINPRIDGEVTDYFEWMGAAVIELEKTGGAMHKASYMLTHIYSGFSMKDFFLRLDFDPYVEAGELKGLTIDIGFNVPKKKRFTVGSIGYSDKGSLTIFNGKEMDDINVKAAFIDIIEIQIPFKQIGAKKNDEIEYFISLNRNGGEIERWPSVGFFSTNAPGDDFESDTWNAYA